MSMDAGLHRRQDAAIIGNHQDSAETSPVHFSLQTSLRLLVRPLSGG
jgi:hypothetical protein